MNQICLVEDEQKVSAFIRKGLEEHGYTVTVAADGAAAREMLKNKCNLFILDVMLPDVNGIELCREIRKTDSRTPILMLTALDQIDNKVEGLKAGKLAREEYVRAFPPLTIDNKQWRAISWTTAASITCARARA